MVAHFRAGTGSVIHSPLPIIVLRVVTGRHLSHTVISLTQLGEVALYNGRRAEARLMLEQALTYLPEGESIFLTIAKTNLAEIALADADYKLAQRWLVYAFEHASQHICRLMVFLSALAGALAVSPTSEPETLRSMAQ